MKFDIEKVNVIYPEEEEGVERNLTIENDQGFLQINFIDKQNPKAGGVSLDKRQVNQLRDALNVFIKNKLLD